MVVITFSENTESGIKNDVYIVSKHIYEMIKDGIDAGDYEVLGICKKYKHQASLKIEPIDVYIKDNCLTFDFYNLVKDSYYFYNGKINGLRKCYFGSFYYELKKVFSKKLFDLDEEIKKTDKLLNQYDTFRKLEIIIKNSDVKKLNEYLLSIDGCLKT